MKGSATTSDSVDPYATLDAILKVIKRTWLTEEWRLEDVRLLAQEAIKGRPKRAPQEPATRTPHVRKSRSGIKQLRITSSEQSLSL
ncbi:hypothetical protein [Microvirga sp. BSC39]|uniref:hypothetical protein n=1 Tax=Microvirga sp. BSC39 TaxID=1549810 RepID=UPI0004E8635B|nr:hypothetical protein [Microvirga sp. BSC39]KFG67630.1 hypothetical protein JH26_21975 [Microvirga sp. BSC39]